MTQTFHVHIQRFDPNESLEISTKTYEVTWHPSQTVLEVLNEIQTQLDDSLSFRSSCQAGKCGSCAVALDGKPVLACRTMVQGQELHLGPLPGFPVVKDLIIDRTGYEEDFLRMLATTKALEPEDKPAACLPETEIDYSNLSCCIGCLVCTAACPVAAQLEENAPNPAVMTSVLSSGVRVDRKEGQAFPIGENTDYCSLCLNCQAACPAGVSLNRVNAQVKDAWVQTQGQSLRDWMLGRAELAGRLGSLFPSLSNRVLENRLVRRGMESALGISSKAKMIPYAGSRAPGVNRAPGLKTAAGKYKVALFLGCYSRFNDTDPCRDGLAVLEELGVRVEVPEQTCCGLPLVSSGDLTAAGKKAETNIKAFQAWIDRGFEIVTSCTSCSLMLKHEYTEVLGLQTAAGFAAQTRDLGEYLLGLLDSGDMRPNLTPVPMQAAYHTPCHLRTQKIGLPFMELLKKIPDLEVAVLDAPCCGQSGTYGFKAEKYVVSRAVGQKLADSLNTLEPEIALSECGPCQIRMHDCSGLPVAHPVSILRRALDI
ncbi:MAG: anaerobic glycerol-3-phosphate dehydrogenase subunit C [Thermodesulfobacteriota bacterium]